MVGQLCLLDWECSFSEEDTLEGAGLLLLFAQLSYESGIRCGSDDSRGET